MPRTSNTNKRYTEDEKSTVLALLATLDGNITATSKQSGYPPQTIRQWRDGRGINHDITRKCEEKKAELALLFEDMAHNALKRAGVEIENARYAQLMTGAAIAVDKMRLLREQPTSNEDVKQTIRVVYDDTPASPSLRAIGDSD